MGQAVLLLATLAGIVVFLVVGGTLIWAVWASEDACRDAAVPPTSPGDQVYRAGWHWKPPGMRCVVTRSGGGTQRFVVTPW